MCIRDSLMDAARVLVREEYRAALKAQLAAGARSFAAARQAAVETLRPGSALATLLDQPNNNLAVEYCKAILRQGAAMQLLPLPRLGTAHGTAQTGQFRDGEELKNYWFAGFYPAEKPRWTIVVMQDAQTEPEVSSAAIFARLCDALSAGE